MRALVTGACGFVGRYLTEHLYSSGDEILACYFSAPPSNLPFRSQQLDITNGPACAEAVRSFKPDVVYHLAGVSFVPQAEDDFAAALVANVHGTNNILRICHLLQAGIKVVFISSAEVYGKILRTELPIVESCGLRPANNYSLTKAMAELVVNRYGEQSKVPTVVLRPFNHIGPGQGQQFVASNFAMQLVKIARGEAPPVIYVGNLTARRDFSDVRDIVRAYRLAAQKGHGVYNLGSGRSLEVKEILNQLIKIAGIEVEVREDPSRMRAAEVPEIYGSFQRAKNELGWEPSISISQTLSDLYKWWQSK